MEAYIPLGHIRERRGRDGVIQYLVRHGETSKAYWVDSDQLSSPEDQKKIEFFMV